MNGYKVIKLFYCYNIILETDGLKLVKNNLNYDPVNT